MDWFDDFQDLLPTDDILEELDVKSLVNDNRISSVNF